MAGQRPNATDFPAFQVVNDSGVLVADGLAVARETWGGTITSVSDLSAEIRTDLIYEGRAAAMEVTNRGKWFADVDPDFDIGVPLPTEWNDLFRAIWVQKAKRRWISSQAAHAHKTQYVVPLQKSIADWYTANWDPAGDGAAGVDATSPLKVRRKVIARLIRQRSPVMPPIQEIDEMVRDEFVRLWAHRQWEFKKLAVRLDFDDEGNVTVAEDPLGFTPVFDGMAAQDMTYDGGSPKCKWVDATRISERLARYNGKTGQPRWFYDQDQVAPNGAKRIALVPAADKAYTVFTVIFIAAPGFGDVTSTIGISLLPQEFRGHLVNAVTARLLSDAGYEDNDAERMIRRVTKEREEYAIAWDDKGASRSTARGPHMNAFFNDLGSRNASRVLGPR